MSARVEQVEIWNWYCSDCGTGDGEYALEWEAEEAAELHDEENHTTEEVA